MSGDSLETRERAHQLMMAELDGELSGNEGQELDALLRDDPALHAEHERLRRVREVTSGMALGKAGEELWDGYWLSVYNRIERGIGWMLASVGTIVLLSYGVWEATRQLMADESIPFVIKLALLGAGIGGVILLVSVTREKWFIRKKDPYRGVQR
jgi:hypothetical protein